MKIYSLKSIARRGSLLGAAFALFAAAVAPAASVFADSLNPLTNRSLTLSSSSPGWSFTDGSGNSKYAPPNSGANGRQTGNTFEFTTSSDSTTDKIMAMTFQYCTTSQHLQVYVPHLVITLETSSLLITAATILQIHLTSM